MTTPVICKFCGKKFMINGLGFGSVHEVTTYVGNFNKWAYKDYVCKECNKQQQINVAMLLRKI